jgi:hypothetical protein
MSQPLSGIHVEQSAIQFIVTLQWNAVAVAGHDVYLSIGVHIGPEDSGLSPRKCKRSGHCKTEDGDGFPHAEIYPPYDRLDETRLILLGLSQQAAPNRPASELGSAAIGASRVLKVFICGIWGKCPGIFRVSR